MKSEIIGIGGGSYSPPEEKSQLGCFVEYTGKAPPAVVKLRTAAKRQGLFVKTFSNALRRKDQRCNRLQLAGDLASVAIELGMVNVAFAQQRFDELTKRRESNDISKS